jgi:2-oxo-hept-3-ene-1,7-dioate hydratase
VKPQMLPIKTIQAAVAALDQARNTQTIVPLLSRGAPAMTIADGYAVQRHWADVRTAAGDRLAGYKIGLTSRVMQVALKVDSPQFGRLFSSEVFQSGATVDVKRFYKPRLEVELAFIMGADLAGPVVTAGDVVKATAFVQPALELVDYRTETPRPVVDMVADNTAGAGAVLGGNLVPPDAVDLRWIGAILSKNGSIEETGVSAAILGHPANAVAALANMLSTEGLHLKSGDIVLAGSFTRQLEVAAGDLIVADFGPLGMIDVRFA